MKYKTKKTSDSRHHFNAWQIATLGGKLSRVSVSRYRKACAAAFWLDWLNDYADRCAEFDNSQAYTEERSAKMAQRLEELAHTTAEHLAPLGLEFFCCSHFYGIARKGEKKQIYIRY